jgi:hypothetical protein
MFLPDIEILNNTKEGLRPEEIQRLINLYEDLGGKFPVTDTNIRNLLIKQRVTL